MVRYLGLDVHKQWTQASWHLPDGSIQRERIATDPVLLRELAQRLRPCDVVALESTTHALAIARILAERAGTVLISNPLRTRLIADSRIKTDKVDADVLAQLARSGFLPTVWQPPSDVELLRRRTAYHGALGRQITRIKNRLHAVLHRHLIASPVADLFSTTGRAFLKKVDLPADEKLQVGLDLHLLETIEAAREEARKGLAQLAVAQPHTQLLMTVPGIDYPTAVGILAAIGDISRFSSARKLVSYFGLNPIVRQSANHCYTGRISKQGSTHARWLLVEAAHAAVRCAGPLRAFFLRLKGRKGTNVAVVAAARKLTVILYHMLTSGEPYRAAPERSTREKLNRLRYHATGRRQKSGSSKGTPRSPHYGTGVKGRTVRASQDRRRLVELQKEYESFVSERFQDKEAQKTGVLPENR
jgi:transposase